MTKFEVLEEGLRLVMKTTGKLLETDLKRRLNRLHIISKEAHLLERGSAWKLVDTIYKSAPIKSFVKRIYDRIQNKNIPGFKRAYIEFEETVLMPEIRRAIRKELLGSTKKEMSLFVAGKKIASTSGTITKVDPGKAAQIATARIFGAVNLEQIEENGVPILKPAYTTAYVDGANASYKLTGTKAAFDVVKPEAVEQIDKFGAELITAVTEETKRAAKAVIKIGIETGQSMPTIARNLSMVTDLPHRWAAAVVNRNVKMQAAGISADIANKKAAIYHRKLLRARRIMIARTETGIAQAQGSLQGYKTVGVVKVRFYAAHGACPICADLDGNVYLIEEAHGMIPVHPSGRCDWLSIMPKRGYKNPLKYKPPKNLKTGIDRAISDIMTLFARKKVEHSSTLDDAGNVIFRKSGGAKSIKFNPSEVNQMKDSAAIIHNHPKSASFSPDDLHMGWTTQTKDVIVCSTRYRYSIAPAPGEAWDPRASVFHKKAWIELHAKYEAKFWRTFKEAKGDLLDPHGRERGKLVAKLTRIMNEEQSHEAVTATAKKYNYIYTRTKVVGD